jgi:phosphoribosylglycinamide formyltransferase-1
MYAIERMAARGDATAFRQCVGATAHFIDSRVDAGPIIRAVRVEDPFAFGSIWGLKASVYQLAFSLLVDVATEMVNPPYSIRTWPVGIAQDAVILGPQFAASKFTPALRASAARHYDAMRAASRGLPKDSPGGSARLIVRESTPSQRHAHSGRLD